MEKSNGLSCIIRKGTLNRQVILQLIGDRLIEYACQNLAEQPGDDKDQYDNKYGWCQVDEQPACRDHSDKEAVDAHFLKPDDILLDEAVVVNHGKEHPAQLLDNQDCENA